MNPLLHLPLPEYDEEDIITNDDQYEKKKKLLRKKKVQYKNNPLPERLNRIRSLNSAIQDYETKDVVYEKISKKEPSVKSKDNNDLNLLNQLSKQNKKLKIKQKMEDQQIEKRLRKKKNLLLRRNQQMEKRSRKQKNLLLNSNGPPKWSPTVHRLFPYYDKKCIELLLLAKNNEDCIFSILPDDVINNILSNIRWDWFYVEGNQCETLRIIMTM
tara:strand:+ start:2142 stop:2783 length:642 start_codon:yes stop_codon:yes gene_type:complete